MVGTMWAMADQDGSELAEHFYKSMFSTDQPGVPCYERSAGALRDAVRVLRKMNKVETVIYVRRMVTRGVASLRLLHDYSIGCSVGESWRTMTLADVWV